MFVVSLMTLAALAATTTIEAQQEVLSAPAPATAEPTANTWNVVSRSSSTVFMVNVGDIKQFDGVTTVQVARVPASGDATDKSYSLTETAFRCNARQSKTGTEVYYGADGSEEERIENSYEFEPIPNNSLDAYVKTIVCDNERSTTTYASIEAFIAAGRPGN